VSASRAAQGTVDHFLTGDDHGSGIGVGVALAVSSLWVGAFRSHAVASHALVNC